jgi:hypothetical protein
MTVSKSTLVCEPQFVAGTTPYCCSELDELNVTVLEHPWAEVDWIRLLPVVNVFRVIVDGSAQLTEV